MIKKTLGEKATSLILSLITIIGGILVSEQIISGESLTSIQGLTGMALTGGGVSVITVIYLIRDLLPKKAIENFVNKVGAEKIEDGFNKVYTALEEVEQLKALVINLQEMLLVEREARVELGLYEDISQDLKDRL